MRMIECTPAPDGSFPWISIDLMCMMLYPEAKDEVARGLATATLIVNNELSEREFDEQVSFPVALLRAALNGPGVPGLMKQVALRARDGFFAGSLLYDFIRQHERGQQVLVEQHIENEVNSKPYKGAYSTYGGDEGEVGFSTRYAAWRRYLPVAHFWAAQRHLVGKFGPIAYQNLVNADLSLTVGLAMQLLERAAAIPTKNGNNYNGPLVDITQAWALPSSALRR